ncbi:hypothetical protein BC830DRAFT_1151978, partial [Chytriomyces sp. MP71]
MKQFSIAPHGATRQFDITIFVCLRSTAPKSNPTLRVLQVIQLSNEALFIVFRRKPTLNGARIFWFSHLRSSSPTCVRHHPNLKPTRPFCAPLSVGTSFKLQNFTALGCMIARLHTTAFVSGRNEKHVALLCTEAPQPSEPTQAHLYVSTLSPLIYPSACTETPAAAIQTTADTLHTVLGSTRAHRDRLLYAVTGLLFNPESPKPFGGTRTQPGYSEYRGKTTDSLLHFIVEGCLRFCPPGVKGETWVSVLLL